MKIKNFSALAATFLLLTVSSAQALKTGGHVKATLVSEVKSIQPGTPFWVAVRLEMQPHWHTYWKNPGESGAPTEITWKLPEGFKAGPIVWPTPIKISIPPVVSYGYEGEVLLLVQIQPPAVFKDTNPQILAAHLDWLECEVVCIPGQGEVSLTLPVDIVPPKPNKTWVERFNATRAKLPLQTSQWIIKADVIPTGYKLSLMPPLGTTEPTDLMFFAEDPAVIDYAAPQQIQRSNGLITLDLVKSEASTETAKVLRGLLVSSNGWRGASFETALAIEPTVNGTVTAPTADSSPASAPATNSAILFAIAFSFIGGLILNLMPCVLPVLSIKILGFVKQAKDDRKTVILHGLTFGLGVLVSFWTLAGLLLFLRAGGQQLGWGFQLQSPAFVTCLASLFFVLAISMFGVFEVGTSFIQLGDATGGPTDAHSSKLSQFSGSFFSGILATLVATPCTAPFMGSALGFALAQPPIVSFLIFTSLGLGMASPYIILSASPRLLKFVPKPGAWMETFKQAMAFLLVATVVWLLWVLGHQAGVDAVIVVIGGLLVQSVGGWVLGRWGTPIQPKNTRLTALIIGGVLILAGLLIGIKGVRFFGEAPAQAGSAPASKEGLVWEPYSDERVAELRQQGRIVFVDFSAAWCLTCQVNERVSLRSSDVVAMFKEKNVALLKADWTSKDEKISKALERFGRSGVPFYVLYPADTSAAPVTLPEILTPQIVIDALSKI